MWVAAAAGYAPPLDRHSQSRTLVSSQRWYIAVLVVESQVADEPSHAPALDLQYRLVRAASDEVAYQRALALGEGAAQSYTNSAGRTVTWKCVGLHDLREVEDPDLSDGTEVYSQIIRNDAKRYVARKEQLSCFWTAANKGKTAREILNE
jgi:hypothetical protein